MKDGLKEVRTRVIELYKKFVSEVYSEKLVRLDMPDYPKEYYTFHWVGQYGETVVTYGLFTENEFLVSASTDSFTDEWYEACVESHDLDPFQETMLDDIHYLLHSRECEHCKKTLPRDEMLFTRDCHGIDFRLVCNTCYEKLMSHGYDGCYYTEL